MYLPLIMTQRCQFTSVPDRWERITKDTKSVAPVAAFCTAALERLAQCAAALEDF